MAESEEYRSGRKFKSQLMAVQSPTCEFDFLAASARSAPPRRTAEFYSLRGREKFSHCGRQQQI